jgi:hypothetical protein
MVLVHHTLHLKTRDDHRLQIRDQRRGSKVPSTRIPVLRGQRQARMQANPVWAALVTDPLIPPCSRYAPKARLAFSDAVENKRPFFRVISAAVTIGACGTQHKT